MKKITCAFLTTALFFLSACQYLKRDGSGVVGEYYEEQWSLAQNLLKQQEYSKAEEILKELYNSALMANPELSTRALFELAILSESRGDWDLALAQFKECENKKQSLPLVKAELELPAHLSGIYATLGEMNVSDLYSKKTEAALQTYAAQIRQDTQPAWWAETFYKMGYMPVSELNESNWMSFAKRFEFTAPYLVRSMELSDPVWSQRSYDLARTFLKKSMDQLGSLERTEDENWVLKIAEIKDKMVLLSGIIETMKLWKPLKSQKSQLSWSFYEILSLTEKELQRRWALIRINAPPSFESLRRNSIKREGLRIAPVPRDIDKSKSDPNL